MKRKIKLFIVLGVLLNLIIIVACITGYILILKNVDFRGHRNTDFPTLYENSTWECASEDFILRFYVDENKRCIGESSSSSGNQKYYVSFTVFQIELIKINEEEKIVLNDGGELYIEEFLSLNDRELSDVYMKIDYLALSAGRYKCKSGSFTASTNKKKIYRYLNLSDNEEDQYITFKFERQ